MYTEVGQRSVDQGLRREDGPNDSGVDRDARVLPAVDLRFRLLRKLLSTIVVHVEGVELNAHL